MATARDLDRACAALRKALKNLVEIAHAQPGADTRRAACSDPATEDQGEKPRIRIERYNKTRFWGVFDHDDTLICLTVYRKGAEEVRRRLTQQPHECQPPSAEGHSLDRQGDTHGTCRTEGS